uniref:Interleukin 1 receptor associated kinase 1 binding protein 1 n=1 Tax=Malurus cyaneus samueli TaxID=2593467 RepID=A0A8C5U5Y3_9PASS
MQKPHWGKSLFEGLPLCQNNKNMTVTEDFSRVENTYQMEAEVCIIFTDFGKMQNVCNLLIEKLGTSVTINPPHFYHTPEAIDTLRRQVCVTAVGNTRRKAQEVCRLFGQALGKPLLIKEEETKEWGGHIDGHQSHSADSQTLQERIQNATAYASCRVFAVLSNPTHFHNKIVLFPEFFDFFFLLHSCKSIP